jgi:hypothetical protein
LPSRLDWKATRRSLSGIVVVDAAAGSAAGGAVVAAGVVVVVDVASVVAAAPEATVVPSSSPPPPPNTRASSTTTTPRATAPASAFGSSPATIDRWCIVPDALMRAPPIGSIRTQNSWAADPESSRLCGRTWTLAKAVLLGSTMRLSGSQSTAAVGGASRISCARAGVDPRLSTATRVDPESVPRNVPGSSRSASSASPVTSRLPTMVAPPSPS